MKISLNLLLLMVCACGGTQIKSPITDSELNDSDVESVEEETEEESDDGSFSEESEDGVVEEESDDNTAEEETESGSSDMMLESGIWDVASATLANDPCDWDTQLQQFFGVGSDALLPKDFTVEGFEGSFEIEANSYGAAGPIECTLNGSSFTCETQSVIPVDFDLGSFGWSYSIVFSGVVNDERSLEGTAVVSFPTVADLMSMIFDASGVDPAQCSQTYELSLRNNL